MGILKGGGKAEKIKKKNKKRGRVEEMRGVKLKQAVSAIASRKVSRPSETADLGADLQRREEKE